MLRFLLKIIPLPLQLIGLKFIIVRKVNNNRHIRETLRDLEGKLISICITDIRRDYHLLIKDRLLQLKSRKDRDPDVTIKGEISTFLGLFRGKLDPDALFFSRTLKIEGDTTALVLFKNLLEAIR